MMGSRDPQKQLWSYRINPDKRVRSDHQLRKLNPALKLDFVREEVARFYGINGNVSEDPGPGKPSGLLVTAGVLAVNDAK